MCLELFQHRGCPPGVSNQFCEWRGDVEEVPFLYAPTANVCADDLRRSQTKKSCLAVNLVCSVQVRGRRR